MGNRPVGYAGFNTGSAPEGFPNFFLYRVTETEKALNQKGRNGHKAWCRPFSPFFHILFEAYSVTRCMRDWQSTWEYISVGVDYFLDVDFGFWTKPKPTEIYSKLILLFSLLENQTEGQRIFDLEGFLCYFILGSLQKLMWTSKKKSTPTEIFSSVLSVLN